MGCVAWLGLHLWRRPFRLVVVARLYCCMIHFVFGTFVRSYAIPTLVPDICRSNNFCGLSGGSELTLSCVDKELHALCSGYGNIAGH